MFEYKKTIIVVFLLIVIVTVFLIWNKSESNVFNGIRYHSYKEGVNVNIKNNSNEQIDNLGIYLKNKNESIKLSHDLFLKSNSRFEKNIEISGYHGEYWLELRYKSQMNNNEKEFVIFSYLPSNTGTYVVKIVVNEIDSKGEIHGEIEKYDGFKRVIEKI